MTSTPKVDSIDLTDKDSLQLVIKFLEKHFPESKKLWHIFKNIEANVIKEKDLWPNQLLVNDRNDITCLIFMYSSAGFKNIYKSVTEEEISHSRDVNVICDEKDNDLLMSMIQYHVPWLDVKEIIFASIPRRLTSMIQTLAKENNLGAYHSILCHQLELDKETFTEKCKNIPYSLPSDIVIKPLTLADASTVNEMWEYKTDISIYRIMNDIEHSLTYGAFCGEDLIGWCLRRFDGTVANVFVKPEARRSGLATLLNVYMATKIFEKDALPYCYVVIENLASLKMLGKIGYKTTCDVDWLLFHAK